MMMFTTMQAALRSVIKDEKAAAMAEYALLAALIAAVCVAVVTTLGTTISSKFVSITDAL